MKRLSLLILILCILAVTACTPAPTFPSPEPTQSIVPEPETLDLTSLGDKITLNGKPFKLPCTLNELGDDYTFTGRYTVTSHRGFVECSTTLLYKGERIIIVQLDDFEEGVDDEREAVICGIATLSSSDFWPLEINGFKLGDSILDVVDKYGSPQWMKTYQMEDTDFTTYTYGEGRLIWGFETDIKEAKKMNKKFNQDAIVSLFYYYYKNAQEVKK